MSFKCVVNGRVTEWLSGICCLIVCRLKATGYRLPLLISEATSKAEKERWLDRKANRLDDKLYVHLSNSNLCTFYERWVGSVYDKIWPDPAYCSLQPGPGTWSHNLILSDSRDCSHSHKDGHPRYYQAQFKSIYLCVCTWYNLYFELDTIEFGISQIKIWSQNLSL